MVFSGNKVNKDLLIEMQFKASASSTKFLSALSAAKTKSRVRFSTPVFGPIKIEVICVSAIILENVVVESACFNITAVKCAA